MNDGNVSPSGVRLVEMLQPVTDSDYHYERGVHRLSPLLADEFLKLYEDRRDEKGEMRRFPICVLYAGDPAKAVWGKRALVKGGRLVRG